MHLKKITGFTRSPHPYQIISYLYFLGLLLVYFLIIFPLSSTVAKVFGVILEICCVGTVLVSGYLVTATDPSDSKLQQTKTARRQNPRAQPVDGEFFCTYDHSFVHESSKHCRVCDRCTEEFDHHCKWINNDVGKKNYRSFVVLIMSVMAHLLVFIFFGALVTAHYAKDQRFEDQDILLYTNHRGNILAALIIMWIFMILSVAFVVLDANLVFFHLFLIKKGLTTYQYIIIVEERKENKREMEIARRILGMKGLEGKSRFDFVLCLNKKKKKKRVPQKSVPTEEEELKNVGQDRQGFPQRSRANSERQRISAGTGTLTEIENHEAIEVTTISRTEQGTFGRGSSKAPSLDFGSVGSLKRLVPDSNEKNDEEGYKIEVKEENHQLNIISEFNIGNENNEDNDDGDKYLSRVPCTALPTLETLARETNFDEEILQLKPSNPIKSARQIPTNRSPVSERRRRLSYKDFQVKNKKEDVCLEIVDRLESENPKQQHEESVFHGNLQVEKEKSSAVALSKFAQLRFSAVQETEKPDDNDDDDEKIEFGTLKRYNSSKNAAEMKEEGELEVKKIRRRKVFRINEEGIKVNEDEEEAKSVEGKKSGKILQSRRTRSEDGMKELEIESIA